MGFDWCHSVRVIREKRNGWAEEERKENKTKQKKTKDKIIKKEVKEEKGKEKSVRHQE